ncbi:MAG: hypothetical protein ABI670_11410 [Chloroflexota bacterium]
MPLGVALARKMLPPTVFEECRDKARSRMIEGRPTNWMAAGVIITVWLLLVVAAVALAARLLGGG